MFHDGYSFLGFVGISHAELMALSLEKALERMDERFDHHWSHGNEVRQEFALLGITTEEIKALLGHFVELGDIPDILCPLLSELNRMLQNHVVFENAGPVGNPEMN